MSQSTANMTQPNVNDVGREKKILFKWMKNHPQRCNLKAKNINE
jgi:hypothetical protein